MLRQGLKPLRFSELVSIKSRRQLNLNRGDALNFHQFAMQMLHKILVDFSKIVFVRLTDSHLSFSSNSL